MTREAYVAFMQYFWIDTDWGLLWLSVVLSPPFVWLFQKLRLM